MSDQGVEAPLALSWKAYTEESLSEAFAANYCLYVLHHPGDGDTPYYVGKAKYFGPNQPEKYVGSARYNGGYSHLLSGLLRSNFTLYIAHIGLEEFQNAERYEQSLIAAWKPIRNKRLSNDRKPVCIDRPWRAGGDR